MTYWFVTKDYCVPITNMFDIDGDDTDDPELAHTIVGSFPDGQWFATEVRPGDIVKREPQ